MEAIARRMATNASVIFTDALTAVGEFNTEASMMTPCSVNAYGRYRVPPRFEVANCDLKAVVPNSAPPFDVANCDLKLATSSDASRNMKRSGNRSPLRFTCSFRRLVGTP